MRVFIPYKSDGGRRDRIADYTKTLFWEANGFEVVYLENTDEQFNASKARNLVLNYDDEIILLSDSDSIPDIHLLRSAIKTAKEKNTIVFPFDAGNELNKPTTDWHLDNGMLPHSIRPNQTEHIRRRQDELQSSVYAIPRKVFIEVGGLDEAFVGWGHEDLAFVKKLELYGYRPIHLRGSFNHLWHEKATQKDTKIYPNSARWQKYRKATTLEDLALIDEVPSEQEIVTKYHIYLQDHRKDEFIHKAIESILHFVENKYAMTLIDDSKDPAWTLTFKERYPDIKVVTVPSPGGYGNSMRTLTYNALADYLSTSSLPIIWQADLIAVSSINFDKYAQCLTPELSQVALIRDPLYPNELRERELIRAQHKRILKKRGFANGRQIGPLYIHDYGWTDLISVINPKALLPHPGDGDGEYEYGQLQLNGGFKSAWYVEQPKYIHLGDIFHEVH